MKIITLFILSNIFLFSSEWNEINGLYEHKNNTVLYFFDSTNILMIQGVGTTAYSDDLGNTWEDPYYPDESPHLHNYIDFQDDILYSTGQDLFDEYTNVYKITNFGKDYKSIGRIESHFTGSTDKEIYILNDKVYYVKIPYNESEQDRGWRIFKTNNAGVTWERRKSFAQKTLEHLYLVDDNTTYAIFSSGDVQRSDSNAISWNKLPIKVVNENTFQMFNRLIGLYSDGTNVFKTTNIWLESDTLFKLDNSDTKIIDIEFINENIGWIACENGDIYKTIDGGLNWGSYNINNVGFNFKLEKIQVISENRVICRLIDDEYIRHYFINFSNTTSIEYISNNIFTYKNGNLIINSETNAIANLRVYNLLGREVYSRRINLNSGKNYNKINIEGINFIVLEIGNNIYKDVILVD